MRATRLELAEAIGERTLHVTDPSVLAREVAAYLLAEKRTIELSPLLRDIMEYRVNHGVIEAVAVSAHELGEAVIIDIKQLLKQEFPNAKKLIVTERHDPEIIGGVQIRFANEQLDMSIKQKLNRFKRLTAMERD